MNTPSYFPTALYLYFAAAGTVVLVLVTLVFWTWLRTTRLTHGRLRSGLAWIAAGFVFLFAAQWFACGIGAGPGFLLSTDASMHQPFLASAAAVAGMFCSVVGWALVLVGFTRIRKGVRRGSDVAAGSASSWEPAQRHTDSV